MLCDILVSIGEVLNGIYTGSRTILYMNDSL